MSRASTHAEVSIQSSADKHSYETVDKPILIMHTMTLYSTGISVTPRHQKAVENSLLVTLIARVYFADYSDPLPYDFGIPYLYSV